MTQWGNDTLSLPLLADPARRHGAFEKGIMHVAALGSPGLVGSTVWNSPGFSTWNETAGFGCYKWMWGGVVEGNRKYRKDVCAVQIWCLLWLCEAFSSNWPCMHVILLQSQAATKFLLMDKSSGLKKNGMRDDSNTEIHGIRSVSMRLLMEEMRNHRESESISPSTQWD